MTTTTGHLPTGLTNRMAPPPAPYGPGDAYIIGPVDS